MDNLNIGYTDIAILALLLLSSLLALYRGFVKELLHILAWIGATVVAVKAFPLVQPLVSDHLQPELLANLATGAGLFVVSLMILAFVFASIAKRVRASSFGWVDKILGFFFGLARGGLLLALAYLILMRFLPVADDEQPEWVTVSYALPYVEQSAVLLTSVAPKVFAATLETIEDASGAAQDMFEDGRLESIRPTLPPDGKTNESGYRDAPRQDMNRLIQSKQGALTK